VCNPLLVPSAEFLSGNSLVPSPPASNRRWPRPEAALPVIEGGVGSQVRQFIGFGIYQVDGVIVAGWPKKNTLSLFAAGINTWSRKAWST